MYLKYGSYQHAANEVSTVITREAVRSDRGTMTSIKERWELLGEIRADSQAALTTAIQALEAAYSEDRGDIGIYLDDGTATAHGVYSADTIAGVKIVTPPSYPQGRAAEYSTWRTYAIVLEWEIPASSQSTLLSYAESIESEGTGGPSWLYVVPLEGDPQAQVGTQRSIVRVIQSGQATGYGTYPTPPGPLWPAAELQPARRIRREIPAYDSPERSISWTYIFLSTYSPI